jgi:type IV pilus assembly protein PilM
VSPRSRAVTLVLPDTAVRVFVLDFDSLPVKAAEAVPVLRFRLRKMVPFDVEHAGVSYQILSENKSECRVLVALLPGPVLGEYEGALRAAGYEPGAVLPSSLAALAALDSPEPVLAACLNGLSLTTSIARGENLLLYRTLDLPADPGPRLQEVQRDIAVAAAWFEDKLGARPRQLHYAGDGTAEDFARWINDPELAVVELAGQDEPGRHCRRAGGSGLRRCASRSISPPAPSPILAPRSSACASPWACWRWPRSAWGWACAPWTGRPKRPAPATTRWTDRLRA